MENFIFFKRKQLLLWKLDVGLTWMKDRKSWNLKVDFKNPTFSVFYPRQTNI